VLYEFSQQLTSTLEAEQVLTSTEPLPGGAVRGVHDHLYDLLMKASRLR
jgi:hypothetical protein